MLSVFFSVVTYKHTANSLRPLLNSLSNFVEAQSNDFNTTILLHENIHISPCLSVELLLQKNPSLNITYHNSKNVGFGSAHNLNFSCIDPSLYPSALFVVCNPDISFAPSELIRFLIHIAHNKDIAVATPLIVGSDGSVQHSVKNNPTFLSLLLGRLSFLKKFRPFLHYYERHASYHLDYRSCVISSTYLSGCFLVIPATYYNVVNGFDTNYFLHLEDADIVRSLSLHGSSLHIPMAKVTHYWARGSHRSFFQMYHVFRSYLIYTFKWGFALF